MNKTQKTYLLIKEIGISSLVEYARYLAAKKSGQVARQTPCGGLPMDYEDEHFTLEIPLHSPSRDSLLSTGIDSAAQIAAADEIIAGFYRPFSGNKQKLAFFGVENPAHWLNYGDVLNGTDIKWVWEPARFTWALELARAYVIQPDERYAACFWEKFEEFVRLNPANCGPNWSSAQECAMRLIAWTMAYSIFKDSPATTIERTRTLSAAIWQHAARISPTLAYAHSQNNNHLLSEALGLIIAGTIFKKASPIAKKWLKLGLREFKSGIISQIEADGTYGQHSANYHRLMMQLSLLYYGYANAIKQQIHADVLERLGAAILWMAAQMNYNSGRLPNLGHNDGSLLLPMGCAEYLDYRPTLQAASRAFLGQPCLPPGHWDELSAWLNLPQNQSISHKVDLLSPAVHKLSSGATWATLRAVRFHGRPAHADQLHLEVWWNGINVARDAGTFSYNVAPPWQNAFSSTLVHNTICINDSDQMHKASKFLWLKQANAKWEELDKTNVLSASHDGYKPFGVIHHRRAWFENEDRLLVNDWIERTSKSDPVKVTLHWLLPDWDWRLEGQTLLLQKDSHKITITLSAEAESAKDAVSAVDVSIIRAGQPLAGKRENLILGWVSPTYGSKKPAISFSAVFETSADLKVMTVWQFETTPESQKG